MQGFISTKERNVPDSSNALALASAFFSRSVSGQLHREGQSPSFFGICARKETLPYLSGPNSSWSLGYRADNTFYFTRRGLVPSTPSVEDKLCILVGCNKKLRDSP